jgi:Ca2+/H+ antiporter
VLPRWSLGVPVASVLLLVAFWGRDLGTLALLVLSAALIVAVLAAVHHAEVVAHRVDEPFGTLVGFTTTSSGPTYSSSQLAFAGVGMLLLALVGVVGLAKTASPALDDAVVAVGAPHSLVAVIIALVVLLPETTAAVRTAAHNRLQTSLNLALGSALASIGLTIPTIAVVSIWVSEPLVLALEGKDMVLLALTVLVAALSLGSGRATVLQGTIHLSIFSAFLFLAVVP